MIVAEERRLLGSGTRHELVLRVDRADAEGSPAAREARVVRTVRAGGGPVPPVLAASDAAGPLDRSCWLSRRFPEAVDASQIGRSPRFAPARAGFVGDCGRALATVHSIDPAPVDAILASAGDPLGALPELPALSGAPDGTRQRFAEIRAWLETHRLTDRTQVLVHGDVRPANLLIDAGGLVAIIGWNRAHLGDPVSDLGQLCMPRWRNGADPAVVGLGDRDLLLAAYRAEAGVSVPVEDLRWWETVHTLAALAHTDDVALLRHELALVGPDPAENQRGAQGSDGPGRAEE